MIVLFTDYGLTGPYLGQVMTMLYKHSLKSHVITLMADAPAYHCKASAYLLSAFTQALPMGTVIFAVIDPGVGSDDHKPVIVNVNHKWYVGPDNGLFDIVCRSAEKLNTWEITWRPEKLSSTFHGRDLYAPVCAMLDKGESPPGQEYQWMDQHIWPDNLFEVIYIDRFGNIMTGISQGIIPEQSQLELGGNTFKSTSTFSDVMPGEGFWYENSSGLVEIAINQGNAAHMLGVNIGDKVTEIKR